MFIYVVNSLLSVLLQNSAKLTMHSGINVNSFSAIYLHKYFSLPQLQLAVSDYKDQSEYVQFFRDKHIDIYSIVFNADVLLPIFLYVRNTFKIL